VGRGRGVGSSYLPLRSLFLSLTQKTAQSSSQSSILECLSYKVSFAFPMWPRKFINGFLSLRSRCRYPAASLPTPPSPTSSPPSPPPPPPTTHHPPPTTHHPSSTTHHPPPTNALLSGRDFISGELSQNDRLGSARLGSYHFPVSWSPAPEPRYFLLQC
jgi:hypothetical protein